MPPPRPAREPLTWFQESWRLTVVTLGGLLMWTLQFTEDLPEDTLQPLLDLAVGVPAVVAVHWRRRWPVAVAWLTTLATMVSAMAVVAALIALVSLVTTRRWRSIVPICLAGLGTAYVYEAVLPGSTPELDALPWWSLLVFAGLVTAVALVAGLYIGARRDLVDSYRERAETAEREQAARVEQAQMGERARIAREMHDVLAHRISLVSLHAGAMAFRTDLGADELRSSARVVQENARLALGELRDVLGVLRDPRPPALDGGRADAQPPQPTLADLPALLGEVRAAGTPVQLDGEVPETTPGAASVGRTAYRIVQEALTNTRKHAPGAPVVLRLDVTGGRLEIEVTNPVRAGAVPVGDRAGTRLPGAGFGLVGLTERAELAGGGLVHGPTPSHYAVRAWLPWPA